MDYQKRVNGGGNATFFGTDLVTEKGKLLQYVETNGDASVLLDKNNFRI